MLERFYGQGRRSRQTCGAQVGDIFRRPIELGTRTHRQGPPAPAHRFVLGRPRPSSLERTASLCAEACDHTLQHLHSRSVRAAQESHRLRSGNRRQREDKSPTGLACVSGALLLNAFARSPSGGPPLLVVRAGLFDGHGSRAAQRSCGSAENPAPISGISRPLLRGTTARSSRTVASNLNCAAGKHRARLSRKCTAPWWA